MVFRVPALEVAAGESEQFFRRPLDGDGLDVFLGDVAGGFVADAVGNGVLVNYREILRHGRVCQDENEEPK
jgi:hypothetical protein